MGMAIPSDDEPAPAVEPKRAPAPAPVSAASEEEDYDAYMKAQMARLLGQSASRTNAASGQTKNSAPAPQAASPEPEPATTAVTTPEPKRPERSLAPRAVPPELNADLSAMREVANANARSAIQTHMNRTVSKERLKGVRACLIMLAVSAALLWRHFNGQEWMLEAAVAVGLMSLLLGSGQLYKMYKFRKHDAELDPRRGAVSSPPGTKTERDRSAPFTEGTPSDAPGGKTELPATESEAS
jgi:hypothetical protein